MVDFPNPSVAELETVFNRIARAPGVRLNLTKLGREKLVQAALGLTAAQAYRVFARAIVADGTLDDRDIHLVTEEKKQIIRQSEALEFYEVTETDKEGSVRGTKSTRRRILGGLAGGVVVAVACLAVFTASGTAAHQAVPENQTRPSIDGRANQGYRLMAHHGDWTGNPTSYDYQWLRGFPFPGNPSTTITGRSAMRLEALPTNYTPADNLGSVSCPSSA